MRTTQQIRISRVRRAALSAATLAVAAFVLYLGPLTRAQASGTSTASASPQAPASSGTPASSAGTATNTQGASNAPASSGVIPTVTAPAVPVSISTTDANRESDLVAAEDRRIQDLRTISTIARWQNRTQKAPYRVATPAGYTLVLTARSEPYGLADLINLEPQTLAKLSDGSYLLSEHIAVLNGARLELSSPALTLRLASSPSGFVSIISMGGRIVMSGTADHPVHITSWDPHLAATDTTTEDGRAYLRAIGGQVDLSYVTLDHLGFWSGRTGGLALTGTDRPNTGSLDTKAAKASAQGASIGGIQVLPTGALPQGLSAPAGSDLAEQTLVAARVDHTTVTDDAFGLFASNVDRLLVSDSVFLNNQIAGIDLHRFITGSTVQRTVSNGSGGNGFSLGRATQGVQIIQSTASGNARDGFDLSGEPLASGPSAVGSPLTTYGNNLLSNSTADHNGHYGVYVKNGFNITVSGNRVSHSAMGIVANEAARTLTINGNQISGISGHGIALLNGVSDSTVAGNVLRGTRIYLRNAQAAVEGNTILGASGHAISLVGSDDGTAVTNNVTSGDGTSAIDTARASGTVREANNSTAGWRDTSGLLATYGHKVLHPMSLLWVTIFLLVLLSMVKGLRRRHVTPGTNPYAHQSEHLAAQRPHPAQAWVSEAARPRPQRTDNHFFASDGNHHG